MIICVITGIPGSGKTSFVTEISKRLATKKKVVVLVNELGGVGVDGPLMNSYGQRSIEVTEIPHDSPSPSDFMSALQNMVWSHHPDLVLVEATGVAIASHMKWLVQYSMVEADRIIGICLVDAFRAVDFHHSGRGLFEHQLQGADQIVIGKVDLVDIYELKKVIDLVERINPMVGVTITSHRANQGLDDIADSLIEGSLRKEALKMTIKCCEERHEVLGVFGTEMELESDGMGSEELKEALAYLLTSIMDEIKVYPDVFVGNIKAFISFNGGFLRASIVDSRLGVDFVDRMDGHSFTRGSLHMMAEVFGLCNEVIENVVRSELEHFNGNFRMVVVKKSFVEQDERSDAEPGPFAQHTAQQGRMTFPPL